ncbi:MAG: hypothetical protein WD894_12275 [Pirellulales bacterium]
MSVMDYDIHRSTRHCAKTGRELKPGETFYSVLTTSGAEVVREDFSNEAWEGPPDNALGWWKSHLPSSDARKMHWAPNDVMLDLFEDFAEQPGQADMRYVLALLLIRRRVLRLEDTEHNESEETMVLYCPRREAEYRVPATPPSDERVSEIQQELARLLFANAT